MNFPQLKKGSTIQGKWYKNRYEIQKKLGQGGTGVVYHVKSLVDNKEYALKLTTDNLSINREYQLLKVFEKSPLVVCVYELDDVDIEGYTFYYILLEYIEGSNLLSYIKRRKLDSNTIIGVVLLLVEEVKGFLDRGYLLGDVKLENIMVDQKEKRLRLIDLGGVVRIGEGVKEFTPVYDRASWRCGERRAEESYIVFAILMVFATLLIKEKLNPQTQHIGEVVGKIRKLNINEDIKNVITQGLGQNKTSLEDFAIQLRRIYNKERTNRIKRQRNEINFRLNVVFGLSLCFFIATVIILACL